jgi:hypothetical protein
VDKRMAFKTRFVLRDIASGASLEAAADGAE